MTENDYAGKLRFSAQDVDIEKVKEAEAILREAGVTFDTGTALMGDASVREWELDWSLEGAELHIKPDLDPIDPGVADDDE